MKVSDFDDNFISAVINGTETLTVEEREFLVTDTASFEECCHTKAELREMSDSDLMSTAYWAWSDYVRGQEFQKAKDEYEVENDAWWNSLTEKERQDAFYAVCKRIYQGDIVDQGSYRYVLYDVFKFGPDMYAGGMDCGYMAIHNSIITNKSDNNA